MTFQTSTIETQSRFGVTLHHPFMIQDGGSNKLLIMLPGRGYLTEHPVLFYLRRAALHLGYDVLSVQYGFQTTNADLTAETMPYIQDDVEQATKGILKRGYAQVCIAGKSMVTPLAADLARSITTASVSLILLTPVGKVTHGLGTIPTLAVIGTADTFYTPELVKDEAHLTWRVYDDLNHGLEKKGDWRASLAILPDIIAACETFLKR
jgi:hypothetical protein